MARSIMAALSELVAHETGGVCRSARRSAAPVLVLSGEFDLDTVPEIDRFLRRHLGPLYHQDHLVIDLAATTFVDSSFIAFVVRLVTDQRARRKELVLVRPAGSGTARAVPWWGCPTWCPSSNRSTRRWPALASGAPAGHTADVQASARRLSSAGDARPSDAAAQATRLGCLRV